MRKLKVTSGNCVADIHISHTGIRVFYSINSTVKEKCYSSIEECYYDVVETIDSALDIENKRAFCLFDMFANTEGYNVTHSV